MRSDCHCLEQGVSGMSIILDKARVVQSQEWYHLIVILSRAGDFRHKHYLGQSQGCSEPGVVRPDCYYLEQGISDMSIILDKARDVQSQEW